MSEYATEIAKPPTDRDYKKLKDALYENTPMIAWCEHHQQFHSAKTVSEAEALVARCNTQLVRKP